MQLFDCANLISIYILGILKVEGLSVCLRHYCTMPANGSVQVFGPDTYFDFSFKHKIFSVIKYMNLPPKPG